MMYDLIVIGTGFSGCQAALSAALLGGKESKILILGINIDNLLLVSQPLDLPDILNNKYLFSLIKQLELGKNLINHLIPFPLPEKKANIDYDYSHKYIDYTVQEALSADHFYLDKPGFSLAVNKYIQQHKNILIKQGTVVNFLFSEEQVVGVETKTGTCYHAERIVLAPGASFKGLNLISSLLEFEIELADSSFFIPPVIDARSIDFEMLNMDMNVCQSGSIEQRIMINDNYYLIPEDPFGNFYTLRGFHSTERFDKQQEMLRKYDGLSDVLLIKPSFKVCYKMLKPTELNSEFMINNLPGVYASGKFAGSSDHITSMILGGATAESFADSFNNFQEQHLLIGKDVIEEYFNLLRVRESCGRDLPLDILSILQHC